MGNFYNFTEKQVELSKSVKPL